MNKSLLHKPTGMKESERRGKYLQSLFEQKVLGLSKTYVTDDNNNQINDTMQTGSITSGEHPQTMQAAKLPARGASWMPETARLTTTSVNFSNVHNLSKPAEVDYQAEWKSRAEPRR